MDLQQKFRQNNLKINEINNKLFITSPQDSWFVLKSDINSKLILFHKSKYKSKKTFHKQYVAYNYDDIIKRITDHDKFKINKNRMNDLFSLVENNNVPKLNFI